MVFFPGTMPSLYVSSCKDVADGKVKDAIAQDEKTGAVVFNPKVKIKPADFKEIGRPVPMISQDSILGWELWQNAPCVLIVPKREYYQLASKPVRLGQ